MKKSRVILMLFFFATTIKAQVENPVVHGSKLEQQLENLAELQEGETEDDSYLQLLVQLRRNPVNLNLATANELKELRFLHPLQIESLLRYRQLLGNLIDIHELQGVPGFDVETIQKMLPYVVVGSAVSLMQDLKTRLWEGKHSLLIRAQQTLEKSNGYLRPDSITNRYPGSPQRVFLRYKYVYRNLLQYGFVGDKDAGEQFFKNNQKAGFDFYSFHLFARKLGRIKAVAVGDYTINLGQGLIHWQALAFKKSADIVTVKRQADILRPYNSAGEYNFERGAAATIGISENIDITAFGSYRKLDASIQADTSQTNEDFISSILNTGYHRTPTENAKKGRFSQTLFGGNMSYNKNSLHIGVNAVNFLFSSPLQKDIQPYNQYSIQGKKWSNYSVDYAYTMRNMHVFGEAAVDKGRSKAVLAGALISLHQRVDASLLYRNIQKSYQSLYGNAFTESTFPTNEKGLFTGLTIRPVPAVKIDAFADVFSFPWLRYRVDAPSQGSEYLLQVTYKPNKQVEVYTRFRNESKPINLSGLQLTTRQVYNRPKQDWRTQFSYKANKTITLRSRIHLVWFDAVEEQRSQQGFLTYFDFSYKPMSKPLSLNARLQYFETDGFDSRIYAYESDVLYSFSIPQFIGKGMRYYLNANYDLNKKLTVWARWAQTVYSNQNSIGSGLDKIDGNQRSEVKLQVLYSFN